MEDFKCSIEPCIPISVAAKTLCISITTVKRLLRSGKLEGFKLDGKHWRTTEAALKKFLEESKNSK